MVDGLPMPDVLRCYFDDEFEPPLPAMALRWQSNGTDATERLWCLPEGVCVVGLAPQRFGLTIQRRQLDTYYVRLLWDSSCLQWPALTRAQIMTSVLNPLLAAMGTDLWYLLDQPVGMPPPAPRQAA